MPTCFVIQPFDRGKFDKRYADVFKPAIEAADLEPYRSDEDASVEVPIEAIENGIKASAICLADITLDNPNVWYELGYARAMGRPVVMVCSKERAGKFPFDIQHRAIIEYESDAPSDFAQLRGKITERIRGLLNKKEQLRQLAETEQVGTVEGLTQPELTVLAAVANEATPVSSGPSVFSIKNDVERAGLTAIGFSLGLRRLISKDLVKVSEEHEYNGDKYDGLVLTEHGWNFIDSNESLFVVRKPTATKAAKNVDDFDDDIPF